MKKIKLESNTDFIFILPNKQPTQLINKNEKYTNKFIIDIPIIRSEINRQNIGNNIPKYLFLKLIIEKSATAVIGVKFGGCGISLDEIAIIIIATTK